MGKDIKSPTKPSVSAPTPNSINPINRPAIDNYQAEANQSGSNSTPVQVNDVDKARGLINGAILQTVDDVNQLKEKLGIANYSAQARFAFYVEKTMVSSQITPNVNAWGLAAYELNGMSTDDIIIQLAPIALEVIKQLYEKGKKFPGVGPQANCIKVIEAILAYENNQRIPTATWNSFVDFTIIKWNREKFWAYRNRILPDEEHRKRLFDGEQKAYGGTPGNDPKPNVPNQNQDLVDLVWEEFRLEGSAASVNIWDNALFTWGRGFAGFKGGLASLLQNLYNDPAFKLLFNAVGIHIQQNQLTIFVSDNVTITGGSTKEEVWTFIKNDKRLLLFFIAIGEMKYLPINRDTSISIQDYRQRNVDLQFAEVVNGNGIFKIPAGQLTVWQNDFPNIVNFKRFIRFIAHLFHWLPIFGIDNPKTPYAKSSYILKEENGAFIKGSFQRLLWKFAEKASADKNWAAWTEIAWLPTNQQVLIIVFSLKETKSAGIEKAILDGYHFYVFGGDNNNGKVERAPAAEFFKNASSNPAVIEFTKIELFDPGQPMRGYIITDTAGTERRLNKIEYNGAAIYYEFNPVQKGKPASLKRGFIIKNTP